MKGIAKVELLAHVNDVSQIFQELSWVSDGLGGTKEEDENKGDVLGEQGFGVRSAGWEQLTKKTKKKTLINPKSKKTPQNPKPKTKKRPKPSQKKHTSKKQGREISVG